MPPPRKPGAWTPVPPSLRRCVRAGLVLGALGLVGASKLAHALVHKTPYRRVQWSQFLCDRRSIMERRQTPDWHRRELQMLLRYHATQLEKDARSGDR